MEFFLWCMCAQRMFPFSSHDDDHSFDFLSSRWCSFCFLLKIYIFVVTALSLSAFCGTAFFLFNNTLDVLYNRTTLNVSGAKGFSFRCGSGYTCQRLSAHLEYSCLLFYRLYILQLMYLSNKEYIYC